MAIDLQHTEYQYHDHVLSHSQHHNNKGSESDLRSLVHSTEVHRKDKEDDLIAELTHHMDRFMLQDDNKFDFSGIGSHNLELSWDLIGSPQSTLWSALGSNQGSSEGSSQEPSPPATPGNGQHSCWKSNHEVMGMFDKMKLEERSTSKSNIGLCSYQSLIQEQIRAIELSKLKQDHVLPLKQGEGQTSNQSEGKQHIQQTDHKKGKGVGNGRRTRPPRPASLQHILSQQQQSGAGMRALFLGGSVPSGGTGVFFPRAGRDAPSESTNNNKKGKGCSTVLIPSRVVQALQLHFDQMAATSGSKASGFPPLHDVLVGNRDGMYSLQKRQSQKAPANMQNEMILPQEWTY